MMRFPSQPARLGPHVFVSERGGPVTPSWFRKMMARLGQRAGMPLAFIRTCCGTAAATSLLTRAGTRVPFRRISAQEYPKHRSVHRDGAGSVQGLGARIALRIKSVSSPTKTPPRKRPCESAFDGCSLRHEADINCARCWVAMRWKADIIGSL